MTSLSAESFTDAGGNVFLRGQDEPLLRAVGFAHLVPCPKYQIATMQYGPPYGCDCGGTVLIGWRDWWPLEEKPHLPGVVIDMGQVESDPSPSDENTDPTGASNG